MKSSISRSAGWLFTTRKRTRRGPRRQDRPTLERRRSFARSAACLTVDRLAMCQDRMLTMQATDCNGTERASMPPLLDALQFDSTSCCKLSHQNPRLPRTELLPTLQRGTLGSLASLRFRPRRSQPTELPKSIISLVRTWVVQGQRVALHPDHAVAIRCFLKLFVAGSGPGSTNACALSLTSRVDVASCLPQRDAFSRRNVDTASPRPNHSIVIAVFG
jgi:hypothetical protein